MTGLPNYEAKSTAELKLGGRSRKYLDEIWSKNLIRGEPMTWAKATVSPSRLLAGWTFLLHVMPLLCFSAFPVNLHCTIYPSIHDLCTALS